MGGFSDVYEATLEGHRVAVKTLRITKAGGFDAVREACGPPHFPLNKKAVNNCPPAPHQGGCRVEVASTREYPAVHWCSVESSIFFDYIGTNGKWKYHELRQGLSEPQSSTSCE